MPGIQTGLAYKLLVLGWVQYGLRALSAERRPLGQLSTDYRCLNSFAITMMI